MSRLHAALFVLAWVAVFLLGPVGVVPAVGALVAVELLLWRLDLLQLPRSRRPGRDLPATGDRLAAEVPSYDDVRHAVSVGAHSRREFDFGLRRRLQRIASTRLLDRHGIDLTGDPERVAELLGPQAWPLLDPRRPVSRERGRHGVDRHTLGAVVDRLESL